jgi:KUP system potassium uptake protein
LWALNPTVGLRYLFAGGGTTTLLVVGGVFLCVTKAEALYADLGHFGRLPIQLAWSYLVFPALILNYAGQAAFVLAGAPTEMISVHRISDSGPRIPVGSECVRPVTSSRYSACRANWYRCHQLQGRPSSVLAC